MCAKGTTQGFSHIGVEGGRNDTTDVVGFEDGGVELHEQIVISPHYDQFL